MNIEDLTLSKAVNAAKNESVISDSWNIVFDQKLEVVAASSFFYNKDQFDFQHAGLPSSLWATLRNLAESTKDEDQCKGIHTYRSKDISWNITCGPIVMHGAQLFVCNVTKEQAQQFEVKELTASNEELERFAHHVSHDLQEPLNTIIGYLQLARLTMGDDADESVARYLSDASRTSYGMKALIKGLLEYSKAGQQQLAKEAAKLSDVVAAVVLMLDTQIKDSEAQILLGNNPILHCDKLHYTTLFQNLISNALKFMPEGRKPVIRIEAIEHEDHFELSVSDNGAGIPKEMRPRVFKTFDRLGRKDQPGSGLGMAISKRVVEKHGGKICIFDNPEGGATFRWSLPK